MIDNMPYVPQKESWDCANGVAGSTIRYFKFSRKEIRKFASRLIGSPIDGNDPRGLESFYRSIGLMVVSGEMNWEMLAFFGQQKIPVNILTNLDGVGHYAISLGIEEGLIHILDPETGFSRYNREDFESIWVDWDNRYQVVYKNFGIAVWKKFDN